MYPHAVFNVHPRAKIMVVSSNEVSFTKMSKPNNKALNVDLLSRKTGLSQSLGNIDNTSCACIWSSFRDVKFTLYLATFRALVNGVAKQGTYCLMTLLDTFRAVAVAL